jgi:hypothetical protein
MKRRRPLVGIFLLLIIIVTGCTDASLGEVQNALSKAETQLEIAKEKALALEEQLQLTEGLKEEFIKDRQILQEKIDEMADGITMTVADTDNEQVMCLALRVMEMIADEDFAALEGVSDPSTGIRFSPYPYVNGSNLVFTGSGISDFFTDTALYSFGSYDGSGDPIDLTKADYYLNFVYDEDFLNAPHVSLNWILGTGNMITNHEAFYPLSKTVEFYYTGFNPSYAGMDWRSLRLVFQKFGIEWKLVGIIHGQWTI